MVLPTTTLTAFSALMAGVANADFMIYTVNSITSGLDGGQSSGVCIYLKTLIYNTPLINGLITERLLPPSRTPVLR